MCSGLLRAVAAGRVWPCEQSILYERGGNGRSSDYPFDRLVFSTVAILKRHIKDTAVDMQTPGSFLQALSLHAHASTRNALTGICLRKSMLTRVLRHTYTLSVGRHQSYDYERPTSRIVHRKYDRPNENEFRGRLRERDSMNTRVDLDQARVVRGSPFSRLLPPRLRREEHVF